MVAPGCVETGWPEHIVALIPAHNEADSIQRSIGSLRAQTLRADRIIVVADNCTDDTPALARAVGAEVMVTRGNERKKAGALNQALARVLPGLPGRGAVLVQDADTFLDPGFLAAAARKLSEGYGAAGGNFRGRAGGGVCGALQRNEYARYARDTARKRGRVLCVTGVGTLLSVAALRDVVDGIADGRLPDAGGGYAYSYATLTEDNWMTLALTHLGHRVVSPREATMSTEVMLTWRDLGRQRLRWKRGAFEDLLSFGLTRWTAKGWSLQLISTLGVLASLAYLGTLLAAPWSGFHLHPVFLAITLVYGLERLVTVRSRGWKVALLSATVLAEWLYDLYLQGIQVRALWSACCRTQKSW